MIAPRSRLLWWVGLVVVPAAAAAGLVPAARAGCLAAIAAVLLLAVADALLAPRALAGLTVSLPPLVRLSKDRQGHIDLRIHNRYSAARQIRLGLAFPPGFASPHEDLWTQLPAGAPVSQVAWPCTANRRGACALDRCYLEASSPLGFWSVRGSTPARCEIRVYPDLLREGKKVTALFLRRAGLGIQAERQVGKGREFEKLREYVSGDDFGDIHWKTTAKRGRPVTKVFQVERTQEVYVIVDASRLTARPSGREAESILERFVSAALLLGLAAERQGDLFGLVTFSDKIHSFVRARNGQAHYTACREAIYTLQPRLVAPDFDELSIFLRLRLRRRALLVFLTELDDPVLAETFLRNLALLREHLVIAGMIPPPGARPLFSSGGAATVDDIYRDLGGHLMWREVHELESALRHQGVQLVFLDAENLAAQITSCYLSVKQRQLL